MRFPGTGDGVARLVEVSMVKVDMARLSNDRPITPPVVALSRRNEWNIAPRECVETRSALAVCRSERIWEYFRWSIAIGFATLALRSW